MEKKLKRNGNFNRQKRALVKRAENHKKDDHLQSENPPTNPTTKMTPRMRHFFQKCKFQTNLATNNSHGLIVQTN